MTRANKFIFVSFASPQADTAKKIQQALSEANIECFFSDMSLKIGEYAMNVISGKISEDGCILMPLYSHDYFDPKRMSLMEFTAFINKHRAELYGRIFPIRLDKYDVPDFYKTINYFDINTSNVDAYLPKIIEQASTLVKSQIDRPTPRNLVLEQKLTGIIQSEWDKIINHVTSPALDTSSPTKIYLFGWVPCCENTRINPDPSISAFIINSMIGKMYNGVVDDKRSSFNSDFCTVRYLLACFLAASGKTEMPPGFVESIVEGLQNDDEKSHLHIRQAKLSAEKLIAPHVGVAIETVSIEILRSLSAVASIMKIELQDIIDEELSAGRKSGRRTRALKLSNENTATHEVKIYIKDEAGKYYAVMEAIRKEVRFNIIQSISETLVPDRLASVKLKVRSHDHNLQKHIQDAINASRDISADVFDIAVSELFI